MNTRARIAAYFLFAAAIVAAQKAMAYPMTQEEMMATKTLSLVAQDATPEYSGGKSVVDKLIKDTLSAIGGLGFPSVDLLSSSYSVIPLAEADKCPGSKTCYGVSAFLDFTLIPGGREREILDMLTGKGLNARFSERFFGECQLRNQQGEKK